MLRTWQSQQQLRLLRRNLGCPVFLPDEVPFLFTTLSDRSAINLSPQLDVDVMFFVIIARLHPGVKLDLGLVDALLQLHVTGPL